MSLKYRVKVLFRHIANNTLGRLQRRTQPHQPDIMVFSTRRGGSTWLIELLSAEPKTKRAVEIFDVTLNHNPYKKQLPDATGGFFAELDAEETKQLFDYFNDIQTGKKVYNTQWKFWKKPFNWSYDRIVFKIFYAKNYIAEFSRRYDSKIVFQMRHPIPTALSICKQGWPNAAESVLLIDSFRQRLSQSQLSVCDKVLQQGTSLEKYVLGWFIENLIPMTEAQSHPDWLVLLYEDMVMEPEKTISLLVQSLGLKSAEQAAKIYARPSYNAFDSADKIKSSSKEHLCNGWKKKVTIADNPLLPNIFDAFENPYYTLEIER